MHAKRPPSFNVNRTAVVDIRPASGGAASLLQSHFNDSLRWQPLQKAKPQRNHFYTHKVTEQRELRGYLLINVAFLPRVPSSSLTYDAIFFPLLFFKDGA